MLILDFHITYKKRFRIRMHMSLSNSKHSRFFYQKMQIPTKRESTHAKCTELSLNRKKREFSTCI